MLILKSSDLFERDFMKAHEAKKMIYHNQMSQKPQVKVNNLASVLHLNLHAHLSFKVLRKSVNS